MRLLLPKAGEVTVVHPDWINPEAIVEVTKEWDNVYVRLDPDRNPIVGKPDVPLDWDTAFTHFRCPRDGNRWRVIYYYRDARVGRVDDRARNTRGAGCPGSQG